MTIGDSMKVVKESISLVGDIIQAAGQNENVKVAGENLGKAAVTISETVNNALLPLAALNFGIKKAREYFSDKFGQEMAERLATVPPAEIVDPKTSVAGPALQGLAFTHEDPDLKEMYLRLLATAMDRRVAMHAHPAFVEVIKQLTAEEAHILRLLMAAPDQLVPIVQIVLRTVGTPLEQLLMSHLLDLRDEGGAKEFPEAPAMVDNFIRLGLIEVSYDRELPKDESYEWATNRPEVERLREEHGAADRAVSINRGCVRSTRFGHQFARAVGLL